LSPTDPQRTGYPNQKPLKLIEPFIAVHTDEGDLVFDPFAGSGTTGLAAKNAGRRYVLSDINPEAIGVMARRGLS
jgi:site-specific DNA-methyltransferase (adenine-specific)